jgi:hypothetical protein
MSQLSSENIKETIILLKNLVNEREKKIVNIFMELTELEKSAYLSEHLLKYKVFFDSDEKTRNLKETKCILSEISEKHDLKINVILETIEQLEKVII